MHLLRLALTLLSLALLNSSVSGRTVRVPSEHPTIMAGIAASGYGDTVLVAAGTYSGVGNRDITFGGRNLVVKSESGPLLTTIDCDGTPANKHRAFYFYSGESPESVIDGFTIREGTGGTAYPFGGGAIAFNSSSPTVKDCIFVENSATEGGALYPGQGTFPSIMDCVFENNTATIGGAVSCAESHPSFTNCSFVRNVALQRGGAMWFSQAPAEVVGCQFQENEAPRGGGVSVEGIPGPSIGNCEFVHNTASGNDGGGGALSYDSMLSYSAPASLSDSRFFDNFAPGPNGQGGALWISQAVVDVSGCVLARNSAGFRGGAVLIAFTGATTLTNCTMDRNSSFVAGGLLVWAATINLQKSIISHNPQGEGLLCIFGGNPTLACCDVYGNAGGDWVGCIASQATLNGNLSDDPMFCGAASDDYRLSSESPCTGPQLSTDCGDFIGIGGVGCGTASVPNGERTTWGVVKKRFTAQ